MLRRILMLVVLTGLVTSFGCITDEDKRKWDHALGDLNRDNIKDIAPITRNSNSNSN
jgi:hypothetical protein